LGSNQVKRVNARVVVATNRKLEERVISGEFREDLYARITGWVIEVSPLRDRKEDIIHLLRHFAATLKGPNRFSVDFMDALIRYDWPRNVRELQNVVQSAVIQSDGRKKLHLTPQLRKLIKSPPNLKHLETPVSREARPDRAGLHVLLQQHLGNIRRLAQEYGVARTTVYRWAKEAGLDPNSYRNTPRRGTPTTPPLGEIVD
jgi:DNA-binding NtrC family response regulator